MAEFFNLAVHFESSTNNSNNAALFSPLLHEFCGVFTKVMSLPSPRSTDHVIHLPFDATPINVRPYRYLHYQKQEIEQVATMLNDGIVHPSTSPCSSLMLLVKKKDSAWRFCVDYWALHSITIRDRFPILLKKNETYQAWQIPLAILSVDPKWSL